MLFYVDNLISKDNLARIRSSLNGARFIDGIATAKVGKSTKNNLEMEVGERYLAIVDILDSGIAASEILQNRIMPRYRTNPIINRYDEGMFYAEHIDAPIQGYVSQLGRVPGRFGQNLIRTDYSMTLFLTDPQDYDGGELEITLLEEKRLVKLPAGSAVFYSTGLDHAVRPVTRGSRVAAISWFQSMIKDVQMRRVIWNLHELEKSLQNDGRGTSASRAREIRSNIIRYLADI